MANLGFAASEEGNAVWRVSRTILVWICASCEARDASVKVLGSELITSYDGSLKEVLGRLLRRETIYKQGIRAHMQRSCYEKDECDTGTCRPSSPEEADEKDFAPRVGNYFSLFTAEPSPTRLMKREWREIILHRLEIRK